MSKKACIRCGACCILGSCCGEEDPDTGVCLNLSFEGKIAHCFYIDAGDKDFIKKVGVGKGCVLRTFDEAYTNKIVENYHSGV